MKELEASSGKILQIGYEGEDNVTVIKFQYDETWLDCGDGEFKIRVLRHGDTQAYNATEVIDNRESMTLTMTVTDIELSVRGRGELQLVYVCSGAIKKSEIYQYNVHRAIDSEVVSPPDGSIIASVEESLEEIKDEIGSLNNLTTTDKSSLVSAINEVNAKESGKTIDVDMELSGTSENPVQNKVISGALAGKADKTYVDSALSDKANTSDVNTALSVKADKSYVDTELSEKADSSDVETALASKANTADMNTALALKANTADMNTALASKANSADVQTALAGKASTDVATTSANGLMSSADKAKLDGLGDSGVSDVQVNGTSVVTNGVAEIPVANSNGGIGVVGINDSYGISINTSQPGKYLYLNPASSNDIKNGIISHKAVVPSKQHESTFYGLAKASGDTTQSASSNAVGQYTEEAKSAISDMLNGAVQVTGTTPTITALSGVRYVCGEVATLDITPCVSGICDIFFISGSTATVLTVTPPTGMTMKWANGFDPTSLDANTTYEINIMDGVYGVVMAWT